MTESRIEKFTRISQEMAAAVSEMRADAADVTTHAPETAALVEELSVTCDRWSQWEEVAAVVLAHLTAAGRLAPAEPSEEETKAEARYEAAVEAGMDDLEWNLVDTRGDATEDVRQAIRAALNTYIASSPVVPVPTETGPRYCSSCKLNVPPAPYCTNCGGDTIPRSPTETGPWQRIEDVPEGVLQIKDRHGRTWLMVGGTWRFEWHDGNWYEPHTNINAQAPFVAAEEG